MMTYQQRIPTPYNGNPFGLVYGDAIIENVPDRVNIHPVSYELNGYMVAANIYVPGDYNPDQKYPAIVIAHPNGAVKEQAAGLYAQKLAEKGYVTIVADAVFSGESGGEPRNRDVPYFRIEDIRGMIDIISGYPGVDSTRIAALGVCGGGGYTLSAAQMDKRIKSVAAVSMFNTGAIRREGFQNNMADTVISRLHDVAALRDQEVRANELVYNGDLADLDPDVAHGLSIEMYREGYEYYVETHAHPNSHSRFMQRNLMDLMVYDPVQFMYLIDQPLLLIMGDKADTRYMSEDAYDLAIGTKDKELYELKNASHVQTYYVPEIVAEAVAKLDSFYQRNI